MALPGAGVDAVGVGDVEGMGEADQLVASTALKELLAEIGDELQGGRPLEVYLGTASRVLPGGS